MMKKSIRIVSTGIFLAVMTGCASKSDLYMVQDDVQELKQQSQHSGGESAEMYAEMQKLRDEVSRLQGTIEEMRYTMSVREQSAGQNAAVQPEGAEFPGLETVPLPAEQDGAALDSVVTAEAAAPLAGGEGVTAPVSTQLDDKALFDTGWQAFERYEYPAARESFGELVSRYPQSSLADDAQFYIADTYYNEKWFEKAILEYQLVIEKYPEGDKRPAAYFKQGLAFESIGDSTNAKVRYKELIQLYPESREAGIVADKLQ